MILYAKIDQNGQVERYPYDIESLRQDNPMVSFPSNIDVNTEALAEFGVYIVASTPMPSYDEATERVVESVPVEVDGEWFKGWTIEPLSESEKTKVRANKENDVRNNRNALLAESDWTQLQDAPVDAVAWATYRQELRDVTSQQGFPFNVIWPVKP